MTDGLYEDDWDAITVDVLRSAVEQLKNGPTTIAILTESLLGSGALDTFITAYWDDVSPAELSELLPDEIEEVLVNTDEVWTTADNHVVSVASMLENAIFTHRLTAAEIDSGVVDMTFDCPAIEFDLGLISSMPLSTGGTIELDADTELATMPNQTLWRGPDGWLADFSAGEVLGVSRRSGSIVPSRAEPGRSRRASPPSSARIAVVTWFRRDHFSCAGSSRK